MHFLADDDDRRLLHFHGADGLGKGDIANYAGKYALYGRVYLEGAIYIDADSKSSVNQLIQVIGKRLSEKMIVFVHNREYNMEDLKSALHTKQVLIVIDKTR